MDDTMSTAETPSKYEPSQRLIDNPQRLRALYCSRGLTIEEIAEEHAEVGKSRVGQKLKEYRLTECGCCESAPQTHHVDENHDSRHCNNSSDSTRSGNRGSDPPSVDWTDAV